MAADGLIFGRCNFEGAIYFLGAIGAVEEIFYEKFFIFERERSRV